MHPYMDWKGEKYEKDHESFVRRKTTQDRPAKTSVLWGNKEPLIVQERAPTAGYVPDTPLSLIASAKTSLCSVPLRV